MRRSGHVRGAAAAALGLLIATAGCGSAPPEPGPRFDDEGRAAITCMRHQPAEPGARYTDEAQRNTGETLAVLRYYTTNGAKPFCDAAAATEIDKQWARLYVTLGADPAAVASILGG